MKVVNGLTLNSGKTTLYVSGEENLDQIADRARRIGTEGDTLFLLHESSWQKILLEIESIKPDLLVLDSIQTTYSEEVASHAGSSSQVREVTFELMKKVKSMNITCFIVGHITKEGSIAGPKVLEHMVDTVLYFEGELSNNQRILRVLKNRFGSTEEIGLFEFGESGLSSLSMGFSVSKTNTYGKILTSILDGSRLMIVEVQSLVVENKSSIGKIYSNGVEQTRISMILAIIKKYLSINLDSFDIYINVANGIKIAQRQTDLGLLASIVSSYKCKMVSNDKIFVGELGLGGDIMPLKRFGKQLNELERLSFSEIVTGNEDLPARDLLIKVSMSESVCQIVNNL